MTAPGLSVICCVFNGAAYLKEALASLFQQSFADFECIVVDDGSTDDTPRILRDCADPRLAVISQSNAGLTRSLNRALAVARGEYVARQDADDVSAPERFAKQVSYLSENPHVALLGTGIRVIDEHGRKVRDYLYPADDAGLRRALLERFNPLPHSSVMFRRAAVEALGGWDERFVKSQDYELYLRLIEHHQVASLREPLVSVRYRPDSLYSAGEAGEQLKYALMAHALAALRHRRQPGRAPGRGQPLPLRQFEAWYQASRYPAHFAASQSRREARLALSRGELSGAARHTARGLWLDPLHAIRRLLRLPDRLMLELACEFEGWVEELPEQTAT
jgi:cellulose synthase/poly-beta-1,6-N-acetylglucosamine synthase-like glycosyltransferase